MIPLQTSHVTEYLGMPFLCSIFKKYADRIDTKYDRNMWKYGTELLKNNYPISVHGGTDTLVVPFCWQKSGRGNET